jgi:effector-binding domain-containing protein
MIDPPHLTETQLQLTAVIHLTIPRGEIQKVMGPGIAEVKAALAAQGLTPAGPWFTHHFKMEPGTFDFEIGIPVSAPVTPVGRVQPGQLPAVRVARTVYHGGYEGLGGGWGELMAWIAAAGHTAAPDFWEVYLTDPSSSPDPASWRTELNRPLVS